VARETSKAAALAWKGLPALQYAPKEEPFHGQKSSAYQ
jgi:hypothetical protein